MAMLREVVAIFLAIADFTVRYGAKQDRVRLIWHAPRVEEETIPRNLPVPSLRQTRKKVLYLPPKLIGRSVARTHYQHPGAAVLDENLDICIMC